MKYFVKIFVITFFVLVITNAQAEQNIVFIDMSKIMNESKAGKSAQKYIQNSIKLNLESFKKSEEKLKKKERDLLDKKNILKKEEYKRKLDELRNDIDNYQKERRKKNENSSKLRARAMQLINENVILLLADYAKENNIDIILNKKDVVLGMTEKDITQIIMDKFNKKISSIDLN